jgi:hypothetical protein
MLYDEMERYRSEMETCSREALRGLLSNFALGGDLETTFGNYLKDDPRPPMIQGLPEPV